MDPSTSAKTQVSNSGGPTAHGYTDRNVDWQLTCGGVGVKKRNNYILENEKWTDCCFIVGKEVVKEPVRAHKVILAAATPVFEAMFYGTLADFSNKPIIIEDMTEECFKIFLKYIYTDSVNFNSVYLAHELYYAAQKYMIHSLRDKCVEFLCKNLTCSNVCLNLEFARLLDESQLINETLKFIQSNTSSALKQCNYNDISVGTLVNIFLLEGLTLIDGELELYAAAEKYVESRLIKGDIRKEKGTSVAKENCGIQDQSAQYKINGKDDESGPNDSLGILADMRRIIRPALQEIRFLTLTPQQFSKYKTIRSLLTNDEVLALLMNISCDEAVLPMPEGFSILKKKRLYLTNTFANTNDIIMFRRYYLQPNETTAKYNK